MPESNYYKQFNRENSQKLTAMLEELPDFCRDYFRSISSRTSALTRLNIWQKIIFPALLKKLLRQ